MQFGLETDDNVTESVSNSQRAQSFRLYYDTKALYRRKNSVLNLCYLGGIQLYQNISNENKFINEASGKIQFNRQKWRYGLHTKGKYKFFLNRDTDYSLFYVSPFITFPLSRTFSFYSALKYENLNYTNFNIYDYKSPSINIRLSKSRAPGFTITPELSYSHLKWNRSAFTFVESESIWIQTDKTQNDRLITVGLVVDWYSRGLLINCGYYFQNNSSNSFGAEYHNNIFSIIVAKQLQKFLLRVYTSLQKKNYQEDFIPYYPLELDPEKEQTNFIVCDLSRSLYRQLSLSVRIAWYKNEYPSPNLYYKKFITNINLEMQF